METTVNGSSLDDVRHYWEKGFDFVAKNDVSESEVSVILRGPNDRYSLHRYFKVGTIWEVSIDYRDRSAHDMIVWLFKNKVN